MQTEACGIGGYKSEIQCAFVYDSEFVHGFLGDIADNGLVLDYCHGSFVGFGSCGRHNQLISFLVACHVGVGMHCDSVFAGDCMDGRCKCPWHFLAFVEAAVGAQTLVCRVVIPLVGICARPVVVVAHGGSCPEVHVVVVGEVGFIRYFKWSAEHQFGCVGSDDALGSGMYGCHLVVICPDSQFADVVGIACAVEVFGKYCFFWHTGDTVAYSFLIDVSAVHSGFYGFECDGNALAVLRQGSYGVFGSGGSIRSYPAACRCGGV